MGKYQILIDSLYLRTIHIYIKGQKMSFKFNCKYKQQATNFYNMCELLKVGNFTRYDT